MSSTKRRAQADEASQRPAHRRQSGPAESSSEDDDDDSESGNDEGESSGSGSLDQMVKKLVRLALACEYSRQPLRRADITAKVLAPHSGHSFKAVFALAQRILHDVFGMTLAELPLKDNVTLAQKRAAQRSRGSTSTAPSAGSSKAYILTTTLPAALRTPAILAPARAPSAVDEAQYTGLYTFIIALIYLSPGARCTDSRLDAALARANAHQYALPGSTTERVLRRMERDGYVSRVRERDPGGEEAIEWIVGPRGKTEVGEEGVAGLVRAVFGKRDVEMEELEQRLARSLGDGTFRRRARQVGGGNGGDDDAEGDEDGDADGQEEGEADDEVATTSRRKAQRNQRTRRSMREEAEDEDEDEDEEE